MIVAVWQLLRTLNNDQRRTIEQCREFSKLTCLLVSAVFKKEETLTASLTGKTGKSNDNVRDCLDPVKTDMIIGVLNIQHFFFNVIGF